MLIECVALYEPALNAAFLAEYGFRWHEVDPVEAADLAAWLPAGCALWRATGGPLALSGVEQGLRVVDFRLQVLAWQQTEDAKHKRNQPKPPQPIPYAGEKAVEEAHAQRQALARRRRGAGRSKEA